jgi:protein-S-isoprenylcysteine O-methyltransferase Ste14
MGLLVLACGIGCYLAFLAALGYLVAFVGDLGVARSVSSGPALPWGAALAVDLGLLLGFGLQHSLMARAGGKRFWARRLAPELERSAYVLCSSLALGLLFLGWRPLPAPLWTLSAAGPRVLLWTLFWAGWALVLASSCQLSHASLFGLSQAWRRFRGLPAQDLPFRTPVLYRLVRHPLMLGFLVAFWATPRMDVGHLLFALGMTGYILIGTHFEERDLRRTLGATYEAYRRRVPMLLPRPWGRR